MYTKYIHKCRGGVTMERNNGSGGIYVTKVQKWGNSLAVRIPSKVAEEVEIYQGTELEVSKGGEDEIILKRKKKKPSLDELLDKVTPDNRHDEIDFGRSKGKEIW